MVVRRIREHVAEHNWFAVGIDLAIVVAGVFLGTQVSNWNQARLEIEQGRDYRQRLIRELDFNVRQYAEQEHYYGQARAHGLAAVAALEGRARPSPHDLLVDAYQLSQIDTTSPKTYIYDEMVNSGLVSRLGDDGIEELASDYYVNVASTDRIIKEVLPYRTLIRQTIPFGIQSAIRDACGDQLVMFGQRVVGVTLPDRCDVALVPAAAERAAQAILSNRAMLTEMTRYVASVDEKLDVLKTNRVMTRQFIDRLEKGR